MLTRILSAVVALPLVLFAMHTGDKFLWGLLFFATTVCLWEYQRMALDAHDAPKRLGPVLWAGLITFIALTATPTAAVAAPVILLLFPLLATRTLIASREGELGVAMLALSRTVLGVVWIAVPFAGLHLLRERPGGELWLYLTCILAWGTDTFAYFGGRFFGKRKIFPSVSPKKTVAGSVIGTVVAMIACGAYSQLTSLPLSLASAVLLGLVGSVLGQFGDFSESLLKRVTGHKDSGSIMPGHGGLLDRVDALLFVTPVVLVFAAFPF